MTVRLVVKFGIYSTNVIVSHVIVKVEQRTLRTVSLHITEGCYNIGRCENKLIVVLEVID